MLCEASGEQVERALAALRAGAVGAFDELIELAYAWLAKRVIAIVRDYPRVRLPADEVLHDRVLGRLRSALAGVAPAACGELTRLADRHIRWALRDIVREQSGRPGEVSIEAAADAVREPAWLADPESGEAVAELIDSRERAKFHEAAARLREPLRRLFCLRYYAGLSEAEAASDLGVTERTVRNYWREAIDELSIALTGRPFAGPVPRLRREGGAHNPAPCERHPT